MKQETQISTEQAHPSCNPRLPNVVVAATHGQRDAMSKYAALQQGQAEQFLAAAAAEGIETGWRERHSHHQVPSGQNQGNSPHLRECSPAHTGTSRTGAFHQTLGSMHLQQQGPSEGHVHRAHSGGNGSDGREGLIGCVAGQQLGFWRAH